MGKQIYDVLLASRRRIPRGCRTEYVPGQTDQLKSIYEAYNINYLSIPFDATPNPLFGLNLEILCKVFLLPFQITPYNSGSI